MKVDIDEDGMEAFQQVSRSPFLSSLNCLQDGKGNNMVGWEEQQHGRMGGVLFREE